MKINFMSKTKLLLICACLFMVQNLSAKTTTCYKKEWTKPSKIESTALDGGECNGKFSLYEMQNKGWFIKDIKIVVANNGLNYAYLLTDVDPINLKKWNKKNKIKVEKINLKQSSFIINDIKDGTAVINVGSLKIGQSGLVNHTYKDGNKLIVSSAFVIESNKNSSKIKFLPFLDLKQNALPTSDRKPENKDEFVLNYLYDFSLLLTPNNNSFKLVRNKFRNSTFLHSDLFAAFLKFIHKPLPTKEMIQDFALSQNMGTIFIVIESDLYILDTRTFAVLDKKQITVYDKSEQMPFYTRVEKIDTNLLTMDYTNWIDIAKKYLSLEDKTEEEILYGDIVIEGEKDGSVIQNKEYTKYYKKLLGV